MLRVLLLSLLFVGNTALAALNWQVQLSGRIAGKPVVHDGLVYVLAGKSLSVFNKQGQIQWQKPLNAETYSQITIGKQTLFVQSEDGLMALDMQGNEKWHFNNQDAPFSFNGESWGFGNEMVNDPWNIYRASPTLVDNTIYFANSKGTFAIAADTGALRWHSPTGVTHTKPAYHEGTLIVGSWNNHLYGLNAADGSVVWQFEGRVPAGAMGEWNGWQGFNLSPLIYNKTVYVGARGSFFYAIDAKTGKEKWSAQYASTWIGSPAIESAGRIYFGTSDGYSLVGLNAKNGSQSLLYLNDFYNFAQPQADAHNIYFGSMSGQIYQVDKTNMQGTLIFATKSSKANYSKLVNEKGGMKLLLANGENFNYDNMVKDVNNMMTGLNSILSLTLDGNTLYAGSANGILYAIAL